jgi:hypothetical protein
MEARVTQVELAIVFLTIGLCFALLVSRKMQSSTGWSATVTPLASIIGSGFLVSVPLLASSVGLLAIPAVLALCGLAYLIGGVIRYNIRRVEPVLDTTSAKHNPVWASIEGLSHLTLTGAYFVSVAYYLSLLSAFALRLAGITDPMPAKVVSSLLVAGVAILGATRGLAGIEGAEKYTVSLNLSAIAGLLVALMIFGANLPEGYSWTAELNIPPSLDVDTLRFLLGLLIIVQGFETSRYMSALYKAEIRVAAMRRAQLISTAIYLVFFILMIPLFPFFTAQADVSGFIDVIGRVTWVLPFIVTIGAIASQFSASVADSIGASGLISTVTRGVVSPRHAYILIGAVGLIIIWEADVVQVVSLASRAFAAFYALQCFLATLVARANGAAMRSFWYGVLTLVCTGVVMFGIPSGG